MAADQRRLKYIKLGKMRSYWAQKWPLLCIEMWEKAVQQSRQEKAVVQSWKVTLFNCTIAQLPFS